MLLYDLGLIADTKLQKSVEKAVAWIPRLRQKSLDLFERRILRLSLNAEHGARNVSQARIPCISLQGVTNGGMSVIEFAGIFSTWRHDGVRSTISVQSRLSNGLIL